MNRSLPYILLIYVALLLFSCNEEERNTFPPVKLEFLCAGSDAEGNIVKLFTDSGKELEVVEDQTNSRLEPNSVQRFVCYYEPFVGQKANVPDQARIYSLLSPVSSYPMPPEYFHDGIKTDPLEVVSIWLGGDYLNTVLSVKMQNGGHQLHFVEESVIVFKNEKENLSVSLRLYHDAGNDPQSYTRRIYVSIPLDKYRIDGSTYINFTVNTVSEGEKSYGFVLSP